MLIESYLKWFHPHPEWWVGADLQRSPSVMNSLDLIFEQRQGIPSEFKRNREGRTLGQRTRPRAANWTQAGYISDWKNIHCSIYPHQFSSVQSLSRVQLFVTPGIAARQASLSTTLSRSSLKLTTIESVMPSSHLILCRPLFLRPRIPPCIRVFSSESTLRMRWPKY